MTCPSKSAKDGGSPPVKTPNCALVGRFHERRSKGTRRRQHPRPTPFPHERRRKPHVRSNLSGISESQLHKVCVVPTGENRIFTPARLHTDGLSSSIRPCLGQARHCSPKIEKKRKIRPKAKKCKANVPGQFVVWAVFFGQWPLGPNSSHLGRLIPGPPPTPFRSCSSSSRSSTSLSWRRDKPQFREFRRRSRHHRFSSRQDGRCYCCVGSQVYVMERTAETPQLQLVQQNDEIPESRRSVLRDWRAHLSARFEAPG